MLLEQFSIGTGDRFGQEGKAQLRAVKKACEEYNTLITPVWNKSHREHEIINTGPADVREEADHAITKLGWTQNYCVDADHISMDIVDPYIPVSDFFTIDVADYIGEACDESAKQAFLNKNTALKGRLEIPGIEEKFKVTEDFLSKWADQYLLAIEKASEIYKYIQSQKSSEAVFEISIDEVHNPQTPIELFFLLKTIAEKGIQINTIAPKFSGDFYKGIDYIGDMEEFVKEFEQDILVIDYATREFNLPDGLKLSIHSGSDKFSLYPKINKLLKRHEAGAHLKTSGTTWLEELIGLAISGDDGLQMVKNIYTEAYRRYKELTNPYLTVVDIDREALPDPETFNAYESQTLANKLEHNQQCEDFDPNLRQFLHCSYKIAAEQGPDFIKLLKKYEDNIGQRVTQNLFRRHIRPLFLGEC